MSSGQRRQGTLQGPACSPQPPRALEREQWDSGTVGRARPLHPSYLKLGPTCRNTNMKWFRYLSTSLSLLLRQSYPVSA